MRSTDSHQWRAGQAADQLPRLLPADSRTEPAGLAEHLARYGPLRSAGLNRQRREALIDEVDRSGLTGRGGAGFPVARKLAAVAAGHAPIVVANGTEGEPASSKDKVLLARSPQLVLDGAVLAAEIVGASQAVTVVHHSVREIVDAAAAERTQASAEPVRIRVMTAADRFVAGEASAVVHWIEDSVPTPTRKPPRISERGLGGRPTLVHNVETLAHLALIARYGASWFRAVGTAQEPGSMLVTILGAVNQPCVCEIAIGTSLQETLSVASGAAAPLQALLLGGYYGSWVETAAAETMPFSSEGLASLGAGAGPASSRRYPRTPADSPRPPGWCATSRTSPRASADHASSVLTQSPANFSGSLKAARPISECCGAGSARSTAGALAAIPTA